MMNKKGLVVFVGCLIALFTKAQTPVSLSSSDILAGLKKLKVLGSVLYVAAHPDDENTRLLAYFSRERLCRTGYLSITRGDGGQNLIGNEQGVELGLIRTQELLAARRIDGAEQFFTRAFDFGFCKTTEEALATWDKQKILSDVVWVIRKFRPDIIITRFPQDNRAGHGHHSASAVLAVEAARAAADSTQFPEQLEYVQTWKPHRVLWNSFNFGNTNTTSEDQFKMDVGMFNPLLGKGYGEIAAESRSQHKSQGFGVPRQRGSVIEYFSTWQGAAPVNDIMEGINVSWSRVNNGIAIAQKIDTIINEYSLFYPGKSVKALVQLYKLIEQQNGDKHWKLQKLKEVQDLIEACSGLFAEATVTDPFAVQTDSIKINMVVNNRNGSAIQLKKLSVEDFDTVINTPLESNKNFLFSKPLVVTHEKRISQPYWLMQGMKEGFFEVSNQQLIGNAWNEAVYQAIFTMEIEGAVFNVVRPVLQKFTDPVKGELYQPVTVVPPVGIVPSQNLLLSKAPEIQLFRLTIKAAKTIVKPVVTMRSVRGWTVTKVSHNPIDTLKKDQELEVDVELKPVLKERSNGKVPLQASVTVNDEMYSINLKSIQYDHIPTLNYFRQPITNMLTLNLKTIGKKIGFIEGAGDYMATALKLMGYEVDVLKEAELANSQLLQYDAIITGVRAYNVNARLNTYYSKLMKYVENGGNLIVQYNTSNQFGPLKSKIGPYPFDITRTRVTDEKATITVIKPFHPLMNFPNKITDADFDEWVQERSIYHATNFGDKYETIFSMNDTEDKPDAGSLIMAKYGKGNFVYTGLVFFRQLPAGVAGAYRLLANMIALNKKPVY